MRRARITFRGAFHHAINRGYEGRPVFSPLWAKKLFLDKLENSVKIHKIRLLAYCIMENHYHLVIQNTSNRMSEFFKQLNGQFAQGYRLRVGGRGYVFQGRYKSLLIQDESYLLTVIAYLLQNPVRSGIVKNFLDYQWSSGGDYFTGESSVIVDKKYVEEIVSSRENLIHLVNKSTLTQLPVIQSRLGQIIGGKEFAKEAALKFERRTQKSSMEYKRCDDRYFDPVEKVFFEFRKRYRLNPEDIDIHSYTGKRMRGELLINLKERAGLKYHEIARIPVFNSLNVNSLGRLYKDYKLRRKIKS